MSQMCVHQSNSFGLIWRLRLPLSAGFVWGRRSVQSSLTPVIPCRWRAASIWKYDRTKEAVSWQLNEWSSRTKWLKKQVLTVPAARLLVCWSDLSGRIQSAAPSQLRSVYVLVRKQALSIFKPFFFCFFKVFIQENPQKQFTFLCHLYIFWVSTVQRT